MCLIKGFLFCVFFFLFFSFFLGGYSLIDHTYVHSQFIFFFFFFLNLRYNYVIQDGYEVDLNFMCLTRS